MDLKKMKKSQSLKSLKESLKDNISCSTESFPTKENSTLKMANMK